MGVLKRRCGHIFQGSSIHHRAQTLCKHATLSPYGSIEKWGPRRSHSAASMSSNIHRDTLHPADMYT